MSSSIRIDFDENALQRVVADGVRQIAEERTREMANLAAQYRGKPLAEVKEAIVATFRAHEGSIDEPDLTTYAELIRDGGEIVFRPEV